MDLGSNILKTARLTVKPMDEADSSAVQQILTHRSVIRAYMVPDLSPEQAERLFRRLKDLSWDTSRYVRGIYLNGQLIGFLNDTEITGEYLELGWALHPAYHNQGYATEAVSAAIADLFSMGVPAVLAGAFDWNLPSIRVMEKCGMKKILKTDTIEYRGNAHTCVYYRADRP